jgi:hypothetical protein
MHPPLPSAGARNSENRRATNGFMWSERLAADLNAKLLDVRLSLSLPPSLLNLVFIYAD